MKLSLAAALLFAPTLGAQAAAFDSYVAAGARDWHVPGMVVAVVKDDSIVFQKAYGVRDIRTNAPADLHTRFAIGSTTKAMTVVALGMLLDEGKLHWDDRVIDHLPNFRLYDAYVTRDLRIRDLLTHRSGLGGEGDLLWANPDVPEAEIVRRMRFLQPESPVRTHFSYNNIMYQVAGDVVEAASGMPWERFLTERIFTPLGMTETIPLVAATVGQPNVAVQHELVNDSLRVIPEQSTDQVKAAGSVYSSITDMTRWVRFLLDSGRVNGKRLISDSVFREIFTPQIIADRQLYPMLKLVNPHFFTYGLGFFLEDYAGYGVAMHTGSIDGMCALIGLVPERHLGFYVLENVDHAELRHALLYKAIDTWLGTGNRDWSTELHTMLTASRATAKAKKSSAAPAPAAVPASLTLDHYAGSYRDSTFGEVVISSQNGGLHFQYLSSEAQMEHTTYETFKLVKPSRRYLNDETVTFIPDGKGGVAAVKALNVTFARAPKSGVDVLRAMHDRYPNWYASLTFTELAEQRQPDGTMTSATWWEVGKLPGQLRIDVGTTPTDSVKQRRIVIFNGDTASIKDPGKPLLHIPRRNLLLTLGFDVYRQPVERTVAQVAAEGFDLSKVHADVWQGRPVTVVGAAAGDTTTKQFWIDAERDLFVRLINGTDARFDRYRPLAGGWIADEVTVTKDGVLQLHEIYANVKPNVALPDQMFDSARLVR